MMERFIADQRAWRYFGDLNLEQGGLFWRAMDENGETVQAVRVTPASAAGGPDNVWHVETGTLHTNRGRVVLAVCGYTLDAGAAADPFHIVDEAGGRTRWDSEAGLALRVEAALAYGGVERDSESIVQIGKRDPFYADCRGGAWDPEPDVTLRGNAKLARYIRREYLGRAD